MTRTHRQRKHRSMMRRLDDSLKKPANFDGIMNRAEKGWQQMAQDVSRFRTLSLLHQIIFILILTGTVLIVFSLIAHLLPW